MTAIASFVCLFHHMKHWRKEKHVWSILHLPRTEAVIRKGKPAGPHVLYRGVRQKLEKWKSSPNPISLPTFVFASSNASQVKSGALQSTVTVTTPNHPAMSCNIMRGRFKGALKRVLGAERVFCEIHRFWAYSGAVFQGAMKTCNDIISTSEMDCDPYSIIALRKRTWQ